MGTDLLTRFLEPPPQLVPPAEALPHLGGLRLAPYRGDLPAETEAHAVAPLERAFDDVRSREILARAAGLPAVRDRLARGRCETIGVSRRGEPAKGERLVYLIVAYDYTSDIAVEIRLDEHGELLGIGDETYQPPPTQVEIERAIALARADRRLAARVDACVASAIPFGGHDGELADRRVLEVLFGARADRLPRYRAWVDLSRETVLHAGGIGDCCGQVEEVSS